MTAEGGSLRPAAPPGVDVGGVHVRGVTLSSRDVRPGDLYAALPGLRTHGARFARDAVAAGAIARKWLFSRTRQARPSRARPASR